MSSKQREALKNSCLRHWLKNASSLDNGTLHAYCVIKAAATRVWLFRHLEIKPTYSLVWHEGRLITKLVKFTCDIRQHSHSYDVLLCVVAVGRRFRVCSVEWWTLPVHIRNCLHLPRPLTGTLFDLLLCGLDKPVRVIAAGSVQRATEKWRWKATKEYDILWNHYESLFSLSPLHRHQFHSYFLL